MGNDERSSGDLGSRTNLIFSHDGILAKNEKPGPVASERRTGIRGGGRWTVNGQRCLEDVQRFFVPKRRAVSNARSRAEASRDDFCRSISAIVVVLFGGRANEGPRTSPYSSKRSAALKISLRSVHQSILIDY